MNLELNSGYVSGVREWEVFLRCWHDSISVDREFSVLPKICRTDKNNSFWLADEIIKLEGRLKVRLPQSYLDFLFGFYDLFGADGFIVMSDVPKMGIFLPSEVRRLVEVDPTVLALAEEFPDGSSDEEYFIYGVSQDDSVGRMKNYPDSIFLGWYGPENFSRIVLYPQVVFSDGEMEAALHDYGREFRAPTFGELMRQLSYHEVTSFEDAPPYPQSILKGRCADLLPLRSWWE